MTITSVQKSDIERIIYLVIDEMNEDLEVDKRLDKSLDTTLFGESGKLDSLGLVNLVVAVEERVEEDTDHAISLTDERAMSQTNSPFRTTGTLIDYIEQLISDADGG